MARAPREIDTEEFPEADRLEGFPHPRRALQLFGHEDAQRMLMEAFDAGRLHHAWLVTGAQGIGKATLAYRFAKYALSAPGDREAASGLLAVRPDGSGARQVASLSHPGLLVIRRPYDPKDKRFKASITIEEVRRLRDFFGHTSGDGAWRVVVVDPVEDLNTNAANALLKSLEEPPPRCVFFLISSEPGRLLPTIRSRCRVLQLAPLGRQALDSAVRQALGGEDADLPPEPELARLEALAGGSVRRLLALASTDGGKLSQRVDGLLGRLGRQTDWADIHGLADELAPAAALQKFETFYELLLDRLAAAIRGVAAGSGDGAQLAGIAPEQLAAWAELWETIVREKADVLRLNLDRKSFVLETVALLEQAARRT